MQDLRLIGVHEDGQHLLLADPEGNRFRVPLDEPLRAAARRDRPRLGQLQIEMDGSMRPREVQSLIRAGASAEEVAERSGWPVEKVRRYEGPVLAEREHVAGLARTVTLRGRGGAQGSAPTLAARVGQRLSGRGVDPAVVEWDSARDDEGAWTVILTFPAGGRQRQARWHFDVPARTVTAVDDEARWLSEDDSSGANTPIPAPHLVSTPVRATTVYDVEAEGGVSASARRKSSPDSPAGERSAPEPVDLMTAMRERASARGKRGSRRKAPATQTPVDDAPREDALPLEDIAYDPESMPPPPGGGTLAHGRHEVDRLLTWRLAGLGGRGGLAPCARGHPALGLHVVDGRRAHRGSDQVRRGDRGAGRGRLVLAEPARLVVGRGDGPGSDVEVPACLTLPATGGEGHRDGPLALVVAPGVPLGDRGVDPSAREPLSHPRREGGRRALAAAAAAQPHPAGEAGDVLTLSEDRAFVATYLLHAPAGAVGDLLGGGSGADQGLHVAGAHAAVDLDLELAQTGAVTADGRAQRLVEGHAKTVALGVGEQQMLPVLVDTDQSQVLHWPLPYSPHWGLTLPPRVATAK